MLLWALAFVVCFIGCEFAGYAFHKFLHTRLAGPLKKSHMAHHLDLYPPGRTLSEKYLSAGRNSTLIPFLIAGFTLAGLAFWLTPLWFSLPLAVDLIIVGFLNDQLHTHQHIKGSFLEKYEWFKQLRRNHDQHHFEMNTNFGIFTFWADRLAKTYVKGTKVLDKSSQNS